MINIGDSESESEEENQKNIAIRYEIDGKNGTQLIENTFDFLASDFTEI